MDPMGGVVSGPAGPGPAVQRKMAGTGGTGPQPAFKAASRQDVEGDDDEDVPWYKDKEKMKLAIVGFVFLLVFLPFGLPATAGLIFDSDLENRIKRITRLQFLFDGGDYRENRTKEIQIDPDLLKIQPGGENSSISYVVGDAKNISSRTLKEVELYFHLYDSSGTMLGEVVEYKDEMEPNSTWSFRAVCMFTNVVRADPVKVIVR